MRWLLFVLLWGASASTLAGDENVTRPALVNECEQCHGTQGKAGILGWPPIAGQSKASLVAKLTAYRNQIAPDSIMARSVHDLSDEQIDELASYYAQLKDNPEKPLFP